LKEENIKSPSAYYDIELNSLFHLTVSFISF